MNKDHLEQVIIVNNHHTSEFDWLPGYRTIVACQQASEDESPGEMLPPDILAKDEKNYWKDYEYITGLLPLAARECWAAADAVLDRYEYEDSAIYVEYPDKSSLQKITDIIYETMRFYEERPSLRKNDGNEADNPYFCDSDKAGGSSALRDLVFVITSWNISYRRQRYYRRKKVFAHASIDKTY
ncbi:MAG: hypothetical protein IJI25_01380 [Eubacterium sp.]|nr:hypothetical protein [Eubacterium sp.]